MKSIPSILAAPWAVEPTWLRVMFGIWSRGQVEATALAEAKAAWDARKESRPLLAEEGTPVDGTGGTLRIVGNVGVVSITGPLVRHADLFSEISGATSYAAIHQALAAALNSTTVESILLRVNSPGGEADGCAAAARAIRDADQTKPVTAYVDGMCASAAYWLASQARSIVADDTSELGSIGVRVGLVDDAAALSAAGIKEIEIVSSQSPGKRSTPIDDAVIARIQTRIDDLADLFVAAVAEGRSVSTEKVLTDFGGGDVMIASKALAAGLIDGIGELNGALASSTTTPKRSGRTARAEGKPTMSEEKKPSGAAGEWQCTGCKEMFGPSANAFCTACAEDDDSEDDEEMRAESVALGLSRSASHAQRMERINALMGAELPSGRSAPTSASDEQTKKWDAIAARNRAVLDGKSAFASPRPGRDEDDVVGRAAARARRVLDRNVARK